MNKPPHRMRRLAAFSGLALAAGLACAPASSQDGAKALNLLGSFLRQAAPAEAK